MQKSDSPTPIQNSAALLSSEENKLVDSALAAFRQGQLVAIPTETVYGLAAPINSDELLKKIFQLKERPLFDPLIVHVANIDQAKGLVDQWPPLADKLARQFWPGPLTLVLPKNKNCISSLITAGRDSVGIRVPNHPLSLALIEKLGVALAAPSANKFTKTSPTTSAHVRHAFSPQEVFVLEGGSSVVGIESTIIAIEENRVSILRQGMITKSMLLSVVGAETEISYGPSIIEQEQDILAPGQFIKHYAPQFPLIVSDHELTDAERIQVAKAMQLTLDQLSSPQLLSLSKNPLLAAREVYGLLHQSLNGKHWGFILVPALINYPQEEKEQWQAIFDRLKKASLFFWVQ